MECFSPFFLISIVSAVLCENIICELTSPLLQDHLLVWPLLPWVPGRAHHCIPHGPCLCQPAHPFPSPVVQWQHRAALLHCKIQFSPPLHPSAWERSQKPFWQTVLVGFPLPHILLWRWPLHSECWSLAAVVCPLKILLGEALSAAKPLRACPCTLGGLRPLCLMQEIRRRPLAMMKVLRQVRTNNQPFYWNA